MFLDATRLYFSEPRELSSEEQSSLEHILQAEREKLSFSLRPELIQPGHTIRIRPPVIQFKRARLLLDASSDGFYGCHVENKDQVCLYPSIRFVYDIMVRTKGTVRHKKLKLITYAKAKVRCLRDTTVKVKHALVWQPTSKSTVQNERKTFVYDVPEVNPFEMIRKKVADRSLIHEMEVPPESLESTALIMDTSGSMRGGPLSALKITFFDLMSKIKEGHRLDLYFFERGLVLRFIKGKDDPTEVIQKMMDAKAERGSGVAHELKAVYADPEIKDIFVVTDGGFTDSEWNSAHADVEYLNQLKSTHMICIDCKILGKRPNFGVTATYLKNKKADAELLQRFIDKANELVPQTPNAIWRREFSLNNDEWIVPSGPSEAEKSSLRDKMGVSMGYVIYDQTMATTQDFTTLNSKQFDKDVLEELGRTYLNALKTQGSSSAENPDQSAQK